MKLGKTFLFSTVLAAGAGLAMGATDAHASETYTVESGDTLSKISHKFAGNDSLVDAIAKANKISNVNMIFAGQELTIDSEGKAEAKAEAAPTEDKVLYQASTTEAPAQEATPVQEAAPVQQEAAAPVQEAAPAAAPATTSSAKEWIAQRESGGSYAATNGQYIGRYQLSSSYLNGDYSEANQERVADQYVTSRYGSWEGAQAFWQANGWY
ncbi:LysM peptidoglycan-binding domain-containing protein [Enterococcus gilvus]|uniref:aggregation-promoting factor n=1 Tax=Enterococcus gilvus TaxID=160453 RepID=UPI001C8B27B1|nr:LysM domain-containing protein [Enterococcus gilvus]MBX8939279.1 LysM peptidoglycan-binding domain-containing protein [Enterococcus gilvus]